MMGGVDCDVWGETMVPGLWAAGEVACVSVHGANRLGGNSLMETIVFGRRAGEAAARRAREERDSGSRISEAVLNDELARIKGVLGGEDGERPGAIREELAKHLYDNAGVFRTEAALTSAREKVADLRLRARTLRLDDHGSSFNTDLTAALELQSLLECADCLVTAALARQESRGGHSRLDFPTRDDDRWMKHSLCWNDQGDVRLDYKPVTVTRWQPMARSY